MKKYAAIVANFTVSFNKRPVLKNVSLEAAARGITVLAGRSGSGKTTLLRALNRLNETFPGYQGHGCARLDLGKGLEEIYEGCGEINIRPLAELRRLAGMVFQTPNVLPVGILDNVTIPLRYVANLDRAQAREKAREAIEATGLWPEVKDRLNMAASRLSGGQQQRLCLARALALEPAMLLLDEPTASLDAASTAAIEKLLLDISLNKPLIMVSHNPAQACRLAAKLVIMADGETQKVFEGEMPTPQDLTNLLKEKKGL